jgi:hypothetical protein
MKKMIFDLSKTSKVSFEYRADFNDIYMTLGSVGSRGIVSGIVIHMDEIEGLSLAIERVKRLMVLA